MGRRSQRARETGDWRPSASALCGWCAHQAICPEWGGTPPPLPPVEPVATLTDGLAPEDTD